MKPKVKLFLSTNTIEGAFGDGKWHLFKAIKKHGSIQKAAEELGRGYRKAWGDIKKAEDGLGHKLVLRARGGAQGGSTQLTPFCVELLEKWEEYHSAIVSSTEKIYNLNLRQFIEQ